MLNAAGNEISGHKPRPVLTKDDMYRRLKNLEFGNIIRSWGTLEEMKASGTTQPFAIRTKVPGGAFLSYIAQADAEYAVEDFLHLGYKLTELIFSEHFGYEKFAIQGELCHSVHGLGAKVTFSPTPMRDAFTKNERIKYLGHFESRTLLNTYLDQASFDNMESLLENFPDHVIELTCARIGSKIGVLGWNTVIWEVRKY